MTIKEQILFSDVSTTDGQNKHSKRTSNYPLNSNQQSEDVNLGIPHIADFYPEGKHKVCS